MALKEPSFSLANYGNIEYLRESTLGSPQKFPSHPYYGFQFIWL